MKKKGMIIANWKMNQNISEMKEFFNKFQLPSLCEHEICIAPQFPLLVPLKNILDISSVFKIKLTAQNCSSENKGAFTGEVSADILASIGTDYVILGHSERRQYFFESETLLEKKMREVLNSKMGIVLCIGESLKQRENNELKSILSLQLSSIDSLINDLNPINFTLAYEPVWAIGTGKVATIEQVSEVHEYLKSLLHEKFKGSTIPKIIYGGSVNASNAQDLFKIESVSGFLVGGASLKPEEFSKICSVH